MNFCQGGGGGGETKLTEKNSDSVFLLSPQLILQLRFHGSFPGFFFQGSMGVQHLPGEGVQLFQGIQLLLWKPIELVFSLSHHLDPRMACNKKLAYYMRMHIDYQPKSTITPYTNDGVLALLGQLQVIPLTLNFLILCIQFVLCVDSQIMI